MARTMTEAEVDAQLARLAAMSDDEIDTDDIPEAPAENWAFAKRPGLCRPFKKPVTLRLDMDVVEWFKTAACKAAAPCAYRGFESRLRLFVCAPVASNR